MKKSVFLLIGLMTMLSSFAFAADDLKGITEDGRKVILSKDGRWRFDHSFSLLPATPSEGSPFQTPVKNFSFAFDTSKWTVSSREKDDTAGRKIFKNKTLPIYGVVMADEIPATTAMVKQIVVQNARKAGGEPQIILDEAKNLSGKEIGNIRFAANTQGLEFLFHTYYYGDTNGNIQVVCYTAQALFFKYQEECQKFLDGLIIK